MTATDTKTALLESAQSLIQRVGVNAMSYTDLSREVGIQKASIHYHFPKKDDLLESLVDRCWGTYSHYYLDIVESEHSAPEKLKRIASLYEEGVRNDKLCIFGMLSTDYHSLSIRVRRLINKTIESTTVLFERIIRQGMGEGSIPANQNPHDVASAFLGFLLGTQILSRCSGSPDSFRKSAEAYIATLMRE